MIDNSDRSWEKYGAVDPYYGVISSPEYHRDNLSPAALDTFFATGHEHVQRALAVIQRHLDPDFRIRRALDFGCGVGRLVIPLASVSEQVVGVDISQHMLDEAQLNCQRRGVHNASFARSDDQLSQVRGPFNFVHSYIVFQHIPRLRGEVIFKRMLDLLEDGGVGAVHFTYGRQSSLLRRIALWSRTKVPFVNGVRNLLHRQPFNYPMMQLNEYELSRIFRLLQQHGCGQAYIQYSSHGVVDTNALGAMIFFQKRTFPGW